MKILSKVKANELSNPNNAWDMSKSVAQINNRVFQYQNLLHYVTVLLHLLVLLPLSSTYLLTSNNRKRWLSYILERFAKRPL